MSLSLANRIMCNTSKNLQKMNAHNENKENRKQNKRKQKSSKHRNDHSIQTKSPLKVPYQNVKKQDLTFRNRTQVLISHHSNQLQPTKFNLTMGSQPFESMLNKQEMRINIKSIQKNINDKKRLFSQIQCKLIDSLWQTCTKLSSYKNQFIEQPLSNIQVQIKKMLTVMAEQNCNHDDPLESSKKIKLQNCLTFSHCQKQDHKEIQSDQSQIDCQQCLEQKFTGKTSSSILTTKIQPKDMKLAKQKNMEVEAKKQLQVKKIMYMLDGNKNINTQKTKAKNQQFVSNRTSNESLVSFSSFNQNSNDQSGFTVYQIQKCSSGGSQRSKQISQSELYYQQCEKGFKKGEKHCFIEQKNPRRQKKRVQTQVYQTFSSRSSNIDNNSNESMGSNKRKVLNDIVAMLNHKYNKNIRLD